MSTNLIKVNCRLPPYAKKLERPSRYKVLYGGRGKSATWTQGRRAILKAMSKKRLILCTRELQTSILDSIHRLLSDQIDLMGLSKWFHITDHAITCHNGSEFIFKGLRHNTREIKSLEGIDIALVEEAEKCSEESWEVLIPTIRKDESEIWVNFNPHMATDPTFQRFIVNPPPAEDAIIMKLSWRDNPYFPEVLRKEMEYLKRVDPDAYKHVWEGETKSSSAVQVMNGKWEIDSFEFKKDATGVWRLQSALEVMVDGPYFGLDFGFSQDPTALVRCFIVEDVLYIDHEFFGLQIETVDLPARVKEVPDTTGSLIRADSARPETISHLNKVGGLSVDGVSKWKGSVEDGIAFLRSFRKIVIHQRCKNLEMEARLYSFKVDRLTGEILTDIVDKHNHGWDAVRYALNPLIEQSGDGMGLFHLMAAQAAKLKQENKNAN